MKKEQANAKSKRLPAEGPTLATLNLRDVGPAKAMRFAFGKRLNLFTGDNGLGKTFVLDLAWWALTRNWAGNPALPLSRNGGRPVIDYTLTGRLDRVSVKSEFLFRDQAWKLPSGRPLKPGLVLYVRVDGGFSVWDPARNYWRTRADEPDLSRPMPFHFSNEQIWNGLEQDGKTVCNGLLRDWVTWQLKKNHAFELLRDVLERLSPGAEAHWQIGEAGRCSPDDVRDVPMLDLPYGRIPVTHVSAGMKRILALAYLLVWSWEEHHQAVDLLHEPATDRLVLLFDEVEAHLHPRWERLLLPSLLTVLCGLRSELRSQILVTTHAPLVLASVETLWQDDHDKLFRFDIKPDSLSPQSAVTVDECPWAAQGDAVGWLVSEAFGMKQARSKEAEIAIEAAEQWMRGDLNTLPPKLNTKEDIHAELCRVLPGHDPFWPRWVVKTEAEA